MSAGYPRQARITQRAEFERVARLGKRLRTSDLDAHCVASPLSFPRVGLVVPLHRQTVVARNRLKRRLRSLVRLELLPIGVGVDVVLRCRPSAYTRTYDALREQVLLVVKQIIALFRTGAG